MCSHHVVIQSGGVGWSGFLQRSLPLTWGSFFLSKAPLLQTARVGPWQSWELYQGGRKEEGKVVTLPRALRWEGCKGYPQAHWLFFLEPGCPGDHLWHGHLRSSISQPSQAYWSHGASSSAGLGRAHCSYSFEVRRLHLS